MSISSAPPCDCPTQENLAAWLKHPDTVANGNLIENHINTCSGCQKVLEELTAHADLAKKMEEGQGLILSADVKAALRLFESSHANEDPGFKEEESVGDFKIIRTLGTGGMGRVYEAFDKKLQRKVAIKTIRSSSGNKNQSAAYQKILAEARKLGALKHDNLAEVYAVVEPNESHPGYLIMELLQGPTLGDKLSAERRLTPQDAATILWQVALGISAAHNRQILHCDLKPSNIILDTINKRARVIDFGLARNLGGGYEPTPSNAGTAQYMSPEQVQGHTALTPAVDIFAMGIILFECLTGERPFRGSLQAVMNQVVNEDPVAPRKLVDSLPRNLEIICLKAMAKNPASRYTTARDLAIDLDLFLQGRPILARPAGNWETFTHWVRRNPRLATVTVALFLTLFLLACVSTFTAFWQVEENRQSRAEKKRAERNLFLMLDNIRVNLQSLQEEMKIRPGLDSLRNRIISRIETDLDSLVANESGRELTRMKIKIRHQVAEVFAQAGRPEKARQQYNQIFLDSESQDSPSQEDKVVLRFKAWAHVRLAALDSNAGEIHTAHIHLDQAILLFKKCQEYEIDPGVTTWSLLAVDRDRAALYQKEGKLEKALELLERSIESLKKLALADEDKYAEIRNIQHQIGNCHIALGNKEKGLKALQAALDAAGKLTPFFNARPELKQNEMLTRDALAQLALRFDLPEVYLPVLGKNQGEARAWMLAAPDRTNGVLMFIQAETRLGEGLLAAGDFPTALRHLTEAMTLVGDSRVRDPGNVSLTQKEFHLLKTAYQCALNLGEFSQAQDFLALRGKTLQQLKTVLTEVAFVTNSKQLLQDEQLCQALEKLAEGKPMPEGMEAPVPLLISLWEIKMLAKKKEFSTAYQRLKKFALSKKAPYQVEYALACAHSCLAHPESPYRLESAGLSLVHLEEALKKYPDYREYFFIEPDFIYIRKSKWWNELR